MRYFRGLTPAKLHKLSTFLALLLMTSAMRADDFTTSDNQLYFASPRCWNEAIWQPGESSPVAGSAYEVLEGGLILNPPSAGVRTFPGDALVLDSGATLDVKGPVGTSLNFPGIDGNGGLILNGGTLMAGDNHTFRISGRICVAADSVLDHVSVGRNFVIAAQIHGGGGLTLQNGNIRNPLDIRSTNNTYRGTWFVNSGYLRGISKNSLGSGNVVISNGARFTVGYNIRTPGTLTLLGSNSVIFLHQNCQFGAVVINDSILPPGTYTYGQLADWFPGNFAPGGAGSITISPPDPSSSVVIAEGANTASDDLSAGFDTAVTATHLVSLAVIPPDAPDGVIVSAGSASQITIHWNESSILSGLGLGGYDVYRNGVRIATTSATTYQDNGLSPSTQYCYTIVAFDVLGNDSDPSAQTCAVTQSGIDATAPWVPSGLLVLANSASQVTLYWNASTDMGGSGLAGYRIYRNGVLIGSTASMTYTDTGLSAGTQYCYSIVAYDNAGNASSGSASVCATMPELLPSAPSGLTATAIDGASVHLAWTDNSNNESGFHIERASEAGGPWELVGTVGEDVTSYTDTGLNPATTYYYRVSAFN